MSFANKLTISRIVLTVLIIILLIFPLDTAGISTPKLFINELLVVDVKYIIAGVLFIIASITILIFDIKSKDKSVLNRDKLLNDVANKVLINSLLVTLSSQGFIQPIIPIVVIIRDTIMSSFKSNFEVKKILRKFQNIFLILGILLTLFYNLPFELLNLKLSEFLLIAGLVFSVVSGFEYYYQIKKKMYFVTLTWLLL